MSDLKEIKNTLNDFCLKSRAEVVEKSQKVKTPYNYCLDILEECIEILEVMDSSNISDEVFLQKFTDYYMNKMQEVINAV